MPQVPALTPALAAACLGNPAAKTRLSINGGIPPLDERRDIGSFPHIMKIPGTADAILLCGYQD